MSNYTDDQISRWARDYEKEICAKHNLICERFSIGTTSGVNEYELPNYVTNIRSVLYLGKELHPKGFRAAVLTGDTPFQTAGSIPFEYMFSGKGLRVIKFYPTPMDTIAEYVGDLFTPDADEKAVIVEFYRTPSPDYTLILPDWMRRYTLKDYVCEQAFAAEGPNQDLRAATYYREKMLRNQEDVKQIRSNLFMAVQNVLYDTKMAGRRKPGHPVLPPNFGYPVNY